MAARGSIRAHVERTTTLLNGTGEVRLKRLPGAGCGSARAERRSHRRAQDDRRILGGWASLRAAAWALESLRSVCFAPDEHGAGEHGIDADVKLFFALTN